VQGLGEQEQSKLSAGIASAFARSAITVARALLASRSTTSARVTRSPPNLAVYRILYLEHAPADVGPVAIEGHRYSQKWKRSGMMSSG